MVCLTFVNVIMTGYACRTVCYQVWLDTGVWDASCRPSGILETQLFHVTSAKTEKEFVSGAAEWGSTKELPTQWYKTSELVLSGAFFIIFLIQLESCCFVDLISPSLLLVFVPSRLLLISTRASLPLSGLVLIQRQPQPCSYYKTKQAIYYRKVGHFFVSITSL